MIWFRYLNIHIQKSDFKVKPYFAPMDSKIGVVDSDFAYYFNSILTKGKKDNTYKFATDTNLSKLELLY